MKRLPFGAALAALMLTTSFVMADNAFSDVTPDDWSYKAVSQLADEGVIDGYPDGTFKGNKNITRYEMGQIVARLMAKEDTLTADQKATLDKLSTDYAGELDNLGVRVDKLENQVFKDTTFMYDFRASAMPSYDNIFKDSDNDHDDSMGFRFRVNSYTKMTPRVWLYGQLETHMSMNGKSFTGVNATDEDDSEFKLNRFFTTYHWGEVKDHYFFDKGPTDDNIVIGRFPMRMGVTGYTYDGEFTGIGVQFGDYFKGSNLRIGNGRANNINYDYTGPMMHGVSGMKAAASQMAGAMAKSQLMALPGMSDTQADALSKVISNSINRTTNINDLSGNIKNDVSQALTASTIQQMMASGIPQDVATTTVAGAAYQAKINATASTISSNLVDKFNHNDRLQALSSGLDWSNGVYYPMSDVHMPWGSDEDVPVTFISYKYVAPKQYEIHLYGAKVNGSVDPIAKAWGGALSYNINDHLSIHGEYLKNMRRLPLNNERPHSFNFGVTFGDVDMLKPHSYAFTLDHIYSQAGTYFGGSSSDVADQYMGHVYKHWKFNGIDMGKMPAYLADKMNAVADPNVTDPDKHNYGGAKFNLARFEYVPMKGLKLKAEYGFKAEDMGDRKMENVWYVEAQAFFM